MAGRIGIEPERVSEKLRQSSFWQGRGGTVEHVISGIDIALWDLFGKACNQPVSRLLGGNYRTKIKPYGSILFDEPARLRDTLQATVARGFRAIKLGWRPFGRRSPQFDEAAGPHGPRHGRSRRGAAGRCRRQRAVLAARLQVGVAHQPDAGRLRHRLVRGAAAAGRYRGLHPASPRQPGADRRGRSAHAAAVLPALDRARARSTSSSPTPPSAAA